MKKTVIASKFTAAYAQARFSGDPAWSQLLNGSTEALAAIAADALPELSEFEWGVILTVFSGGQGDFVYPLNLAPRILSYFDALELSQLSENKQHLVRKVHSMSQAQQFALLDMCRKIYAAGNQGSGRLMALIEKLKAV